MRICRVATFAAFLVCVFGCGINVVPGNAPAPGNWAIYPANASPAAGSSGSPVPLVGGSLAISALSASANFYLSGNACFAPGNLVFSGKFTPAGHLTLSSAPDDGQVITLAGDFSASGTFLTNGTFSIAGGCAAGQTGYFVGQRMPILTGTWSGTATFNAPSATPPSFQSSVSLQLDQSSAATDFWYPLSGTLQLSASTCGFASGTLVQNMPVENQSLFLSSTAGYEWWASALMNDGSHIQISGRFPVPGSSSGQATLSVSGGACDGYTATGVNLAAP